jgi:alanyl-tRNA synthetase
LISKPSIAKWNYSAGSGEEKEDKLFFELKEKFGETKFLGYEKLEGSSKILFISTAPNAFVILDQTTFYATSGGQKGDDGKIISGANFWRRWTRTTSRL